MVQLPCCSSRNHDSSLITQVSIAKPHSHVSNIKRSSFPKYLQSMLLPFAALANAEPTHAVAHQRTTDLPSSCHQGLPVLQLCVLDSFTV